MIIKTPRAILPDPIQLAFNGKLQLKKAITNFNDPQVLAKFLDRSEKVFCCSSIKWFTRMKSPHQAQGTFFKYFRPII